MSGKTETKIDMSDPMVAFIVANPGKTFILKSDDVGRAERIQSQVFEAWCEYLRATDQRQKLRAWKWMREGNNSKALTLPCADPAEFDVWRKRSFQRSEERRVGK